MVKITLRQFLELMRNELTSHSRQWIEFKYYLDNEPIDPNTVIPYGYSHYYGDCIVEHFCLNDYMQRMEICLKSDSKQVDNRSMRQVLELEETLRQKVRWKMTRLTLEELCALYVVEGLCFILEDGQIAKVVPR